MGPTMVLHAVVSCRLRQGGDFFPASSCAFSSFSCSPPIRRKSPHSEVALTFQQMKEGETNKRPIKVGFLN